MSQSLASGDSVTVDSSRTPTPEISPNPPATVSNDDTKEEKDNDLNTSQQSQGGSGLECPICLQSCIHPPELPCGHIFCYLCIKGAMTQGGPQRCPICRQDIPHHVITNPNIKDPSKLFSQSTSTSGFLWYYEARRGGWWEYDARTMQDLERAYESKLPSTQLVIAGHMYEIDFSEMIQYPSGNRSQFRRIKRDMPRTDKVGVAGIRIRPAPTEGTKISGTHPNGDLGSSTMLTAASGSSFSGGVGAHPHPRRTRSNSYRNYASTTSIQYTIDSVARNTISPNSGNPISSNSVTFYIPNGQGPKSGVSGNGAMVNGNQSESEESGNGEEIEDEEDSLDEDDDEDMELGEEDESSEDEGDDGDYYDGRDGARAPTSRSDRSTSSSNHFQTPPPDSVDLSVPNGRSNSSIGMRTRARGSRNSNSSRATPTEGGRSFSSAGMTTHPGFPFSPTPTGVDTTADQIVPSSISVPTSPTGNLRMAPISIMGNNNMGPSNFIRIGNGLRITVDYDAGEADEEIL